MSDFYLAQAPTGDDGTGAADDSSLPFATFNGIESAGLGNGDRIIILGDYEIGSGDNSGFIDIDDDYSVEGASGVNPVITGNNTSGTSRVLRVSSSAVDTDCTRFANLVADGRGSITRTIEIPGDTSGTAPERQLVRSVTARGGSASNFYVGIREGLIEFIDIATSGDVFYGLNTATTTAGVDAVTQINVRGFRVGDINLTSTSGGLISVQRATAASHDVNVLFENMVGTAEYSGGSGGMMFVRMEGADAPVIKDCDLRLVSNGPSTNTGISIDGNSGNTTDNAVVVGNILEFIAETGHAMRLGDDTNTYAETGNFVGNWVMGEYYAGSTPHGISLAYHSNGSIFGNVVRNTYAAILVSRTSGCRVVGNLTYDCYGPNLYVKGAGHSGTGASAHADNTIANNICVVPSSTLMRNYGVIAVNSQDSGTYDTTYASITGNTVIVQDPVGLFDRNGSLASINTDQVCEMNQNVYIIPKDVVDVSSDDLFELDSALSGPNARLDEWQADSRVNGDRIIELPQAEIDELVEYYGELAARPGTGGSNLGMTLPLLTALGI